MTDVFLEVVVIAADAALVGIESRDEIETPLEDALLTAGFGEVTGGGGGRGVYVVDIEVLSDEYFTDALRLIRNVLQELRVPPSTLIKRRQPMMQTYPVYI